MDFIDVMLIGGFLEIFGATGALLLAIANFRSLSKILMGLAFVGLIMMICGAAYGFNDGSAFNTTANATPTIACSWANNSTASVLICPR